MKVSTGFSSAVATFGLLVATADSALAFVTPNSAAPHDIVSSSTSLSGMKSPFSETSTTTPQQFFGSALLSAALLFGSAAAPILANPAPAHANDSKVVGQLKGSGLVFKDTLNIERFEDPKVKGVVLYISNFDRPVTEKLSKGNFFNDPSQASVACARTGPKVAIASNINKSPQGEEVFEESRSLLFKTLRVQRVYDEETKTAVYVSYNTRLDKSDDSNKSRFKSSLCAVNLEDYGAQQSQMAAAAAAAASKVTP